MKILSKRVVGKDRTHVKFSLGEMGSGLIWDAIAFGLANKTNTLDDSIDVVYRLKKTTYNKPNNTGSLYELEILDFM